MKRNTFIIIHVLTLWFSQSVLSQSVRISNAIDEGISCYKIETTNATYFLDKEGGGFVSLVDNDDNDWLSYKQGGGSAGEYRGIPNSGELHPGYTGGTSITSFALGVWHDSVTVQSSRNGESVTWEFYPDYVKMKMESIGGNDGKFWVQYEGTPGGTIESIDSLHLSNGNEYTIVSDYPFGGSDIVNATDKALGSEWMYVTDGGLDRSFFMAITDDVINDTYYLMENNMTVMGFGRTQGSTAELRRGSETTVVMGLVESKVDTDVINQIDVSWNKGRTLPTESTSDDFSSSLLNTDIWILEDPVGGAIVEMTGTQASLSIPAGFPHDGWVSGNATTRLMQSVVNSDFEIEVKFESALSDNMQYGLLIEETDNRYIRFNAYRSGTSNVFAAFLDGNSYDIKTNNELGSSDPAWLRISRTGNIWSCAYSFDGVNWTTAVTFEQELTVRQVGPFIGNSGKAPAHTALIDYFFNNALPIVPEDNGSIDSASPMISDVDIVVLPNSATISWTTDEAASSRIDYGLSSSYTEAEELVSVRKSHSLSLGNLEQGTTYHFQISSTDGVGNGAVYPELTFTTTTDYLAPNLTVWHGLQQKIGYLGDAQDDFNLMGNVTDENEVTLLSYSINGESLNYLTVGYRADGFGDGRRIAATGDFNADIPIEQFVIGTNTIVLTAKDNLGNETVKTVKVECGLGSYSLPSNIDWDNITNPQDVGQYVDGEWAIDSEGLKIMQTGYDRLFLIGDRTWVDYEVTVPFTYHGRDAVRGPNSGSAGIGIVMRFAGHAVGGFRDFPLAQPKWGYQPFGAIGWLRWTGGPVKEYHPGDSDNTVDHGDFQQAIPGQKYWMKMKCVTLPDINGMSTTEYSWKIWVEGETEPTTWDWQEVQTSEHALRNGGFALVAHHVDATFGDVIVTSTADSTDLSPPVMSDITVVPGEKSAIISWTTDEYSLGTLNYGLTPSYTNSTTTKVFAKSHSITLTNLTLETEYHYEIISTDATGNISASTDLARNVSFTTDPIVRVASDDFSENLLNTDLWTLKDPQGGASVNMTGSQLSISIPSGIPHDPWTSGNTSTRLMQNISNLDFEMSVKFESGLSKDMSYGFLVEESDTRYLRFDIYNTGSPKIFSALLDGNTSYIKTNSALPDIARPTWLRVGRVGDDWTYDYSFDGENWTTAVTFNQSIEVNDVGLFIGSFSSKPSHTALVDYFFNTTAPILPEDEVSPPAIENINVETTATGATISWTTDQSADSRVDYGLLAAAYTDHVEDSSSLLTKHSMAIQGLSVNTEYHYKISSSDGTSSSTMDLTFTTESIRDIVSDDFSSSVLDTALWLLEDPVGGAQVEMTETQVSIAIPGGTAHDLWVEGNASTRLMQSVSDADFEIELKFETGLSDGMSYGLLIEETDSRYLRFDIYNNGSNKVFAAFLDGGTFDIKTNTSVSMSTSIWIRVGRIGNSWTYSYSSDGLSWTIAVSFDKALTVNQVGPFVGNFGSTPTHTALVDYFFSTSSPIIPEDGGIADEKAPVISNIDVVVSANRATISWTTDEVAISQVNYGLTSSYGHSSEETNLTTNHSVELSGLNSETLYHYQVGSTDGSGNSSTSVDLSFTTGMLLPTFVSDDFNATILNTSLWTLVDPVGGASAAIVEGQLSITVPSGTDHDAWKNGNTAVRLMQSVDNVDLEIEVKFNSQLDAEIQGYGLLFEDINGSFLRFDMYHKSNYYAFSAFVNGGSASIYSNAQITTTSAVWMRVNRVGNNWTYLYSPDGENWTEVTTFTRNFTLSKVGPFAGNYGGNLAPENIVLVDYILENSSFAISSEALTSVPIVQNTMRPQLEMIENKEGETLFSVDGLWDVDFELQQKSKHSNRFETIRIVQPQSYGSEGYFISLKNNEITSGVNEFRLIQKNTENGQNRISDVIQIDSFTQFYVSQAYPNPFDLKTRFSIFISDEQRLYIKVFDMMGRYTYTLFDDVLEANQEHQFSFDGSGLPQGTYFIRIVGEGFSENIKVFLKK